MHREGYEWHTMGLAEKQLWHPALAGRFGQAIVKIATLFHPARRMCRFRLVGIDTIDSEEFQRTGRQGESGLGPAATPESLHVVLRFIIQALMCY
jgi:hypothetical protein